MRFTKSRWGRLAAVLILAALMSMACGDDKATGPISDDDLVVDDPPRALYTDQTEPRVELPDDPQALAAIRPPFTQVGEDTGEDGLVYAAALGGYYILRIQEPDGSFMYRYDPVTDTWTFEDSLPRQAGPTYTLSYLYEITRREEFRMAAEFSHESINQRWPANDSLSYAFPIAHWIIGLVVHSRALDNTDWGQALGFDVNERLNIMAGFLLENQLEDGSFTRRGYHPGAQFLQALWAMWTHTGDELYLDAIERGLRYFYDNPDEHEYDLLLGVWGVEVLMNLHHVRPQPWLEDFTWKLVDPLAASQILPGADVPNQWIGGFYQIPKYEQSAPGALSMYCTEAIIDAYLLAKRIGDTERAERYRNRALLGARYLLELQYRLGDTDIYVERDMILGGVPFGLERPALRVDITRHLINTYLKIVTYLDLEDYPGSWEQPWEPSFPPSGGDMGSTLPMD